MELHLIFEKLSLKNQNGRSLFLSISKLISTACIAYKDQVWNRQKIKLAQLVFSNSFFLRIKSRSVG